MKGELSSTMLEAIDYAREHGGKLTRYPGGYWASRPAARDFGTPTIEALVKRGFATYTAWQEHSSGNGRFPIEVTVNMPSRASNAKRATLSR